MTVPLAVRDHLKHDHQGPAYSSSYYWSNRALHSFLVPSWWVKWRTSPSHTFSIEQASINSPHTFKLSSYLGQSEAELQQSDCSGSVLK